MVHVLLPCPFRPCLFSTSEEVYLSGQRSCSIWRKHALSPSVSFQTSEQTDKPALETSISVTLNTHVDIGIHTDINTSVSVDANTTAYAYIHMYMYIYNIYVPDTFRVYLQY